MTISQPSTVPILVDDPDAALAFYRDTLGLTVKFEVAQEGFGGSHCQREPARDRDRPVAAARRPLRGGRRRDRRRARQGQLYPAHFRVDDLDSTFAKIAETPGVEVLSEPASQPWGVRDAAVRDPAGNRLRIEQA